MNTVDTVECQRKERIRSTVGLCLFQNAFKHTTQSPQHTYVASSRFAPFNPSLRAKYEFETLNIENRLIDLSKINVTRKKISMSLIENNAIQLVIFLFQKILW